MEQDNYTTMTESESKRLDVSISMALLCRNIFVKYLKGLELPDADIIDTIAEPEDAADFYERLLRISDQRLSVGVLMSDMGAEEYKVIVNFARGRLGKKPLFKNIDVDSATHAWLEASEEAS